MSSRRPVKNVDTSNQMSLFVESDVPAQQASDALDGPVKFNRPDPREIYLGGTRLDEYLRRAGLDAPLEIRSLLLSLDWEAFEQRYKKEGRRPYGPEAMMGIILYGLSKGISGLRGLEELARLDLGCMWISGGLCPDHATFGRFIQKHDEQISGDMLHALTAAVLKRSGGDVSVVSGDGTVVEAAVSRYGNMRREALQQAAEAARQRAEEAPEDNKQARRAEQLECAQAQLESRAEARRAKGRDPETTQINPLDPEAMVQPQKDKTYAASFKPSVLANSQRIIVGWGVDPGSETAVVESMLEQASRHGPLETALFDAAYHCDAVIEACARHDVELLCPEGALWRRHDTGHAKQGKYYSKRQFRYDAEQDVYLCPAGQRLVRDGTGKHQGGEYVNYRGTHCSDCPQRTACTTAKAGRTIKRYGGDAAKEALRQKMEDPQIRERYRQRQAMVEPVFSALKWQQNLRRFRRRGLAAVKREFALHVMAYNLGRMLILARTDGSGSPLVRFLEAMLRQCRDFLENSRGFFRRMTIRSDSVQEAPQIMRFA